MDASRVEELEVGPGPGLGPLAVMVPHILAAGPPGPTPIQNAPSSSPLVRKVGSSRVDLQACKLEYSIVSPK